MASAVATGHCAICHCYNSIRRLQSTNQKPFCRLNLQRMLLMFPPYPQQIRACLQVCVDPAYRRMGLAKWMLDMHGRLWLPNLLPHVRTRSLICKAEQIGLFMGAGFELVGPSEIKRGKCQWYEMRQAL